MEEGNIRRIIGTFFKNRFSAQTAGRFFYWLRIDTDIREKEEALEEIWEHTPSMATDKTRADFARLRARIETARRPAGHRHPLRRIARYAAALVLLAATGLAAYFAAVSSAPDTSSPRMAEHFVPYGESQEITLPDGSVVWVNAGSVLIYPESFTGRTRSVYLNGEADFSVAKNPKKPFVVHTKNMQVEALGTVFCVQSYPGARYVRTSLEEGSVRVRVSTDGGAELYSAVLTPDKQLTYARHTNEVAIDDVDAASLVMWREGHLIFQNAPLEEIVLKLEKRYNIRISYNAALYEGRYYYIKFQPHETAEQAIAILAKLIGASYQFNESVVYLH